ncbi:hypothetical protein HPB47_024470 [Ixodes persulcatus]|uniref:Uncharacterized protein n=1 Tax=Ixodes persulcatus TaxID=34615 RepID=A0AC60Q472_IXOPE|nr:hypothetical protein HPB47_024470 [Ixodes persulcatus]
MRMQRDKAYPAARGGNGGEEKARQPGLQVEQPSMHVSWTHLFASNGQSRARALGSQETVHPMLLSVSVCTNTEVRTPAHAKGSWLLPKIQKATGPTLSPVKQRAGATLCSAYSNWEVQKACHFSLCTSKLVGANVASVPQLP